MPDRRAATPRRTATTGATPVHWRPDATVLRRLHPTPARAGVGMLVQAADGSIVAANDDALRILGVTWEALLAAPVLPLRGLGRDGLPLAPDAIPGVAGLRAGRPHPEVLVGVAVGVPPGLGAAGSRAGAPEPAATRWVTVGSTPLVDGDEVVAAVHVFRDVSAGVAAQEAVQRALGVLRGLLEGPVPEGVAGTDLSPDELALLVGDLADVVFRADTAGRFRWLSPGTFSLLGWTPEQLVGRGLSEFLDPDDLLGLLRGVAAGGATARHDIAVRTAAGGRVAVSLALHGLRDAAGVVTGVLGAMTDVDADRRARAALRDAEARARDIAEHASDVVFACDRRGRLTWVSSSVTSIGRPPESLVGSMLAALVHPADRAGLLAALEEPAERAALDLRVVTGDGEPRWVALTLRTSRDAHRRLVRAVGSWRDLGGEMPARTALAERERRYRVLAERSPDVLFRSDAALRLQWLSPSLPELLGWRPADLVGRSGLELVHVEDVGRLRAAFEGDVEGDVEDASGEVVRVEGRLRTMSGDWRWVGVSARRLPLGRGDDSGWVGSWRDLTAEVELRERLQAAEEAYRTIADNASDVVYRTDGHGRLTWVSASVTPALGWAPEHLLGRPSTDVVHPDDVPVVMAAAREAVRGESAARFEARLRRADGGYTWFAVTARPAYDAEGRLLARIGSGRVVDAEVSARHAAAAANEQLSLVLEHLRDVLYDVGPDGVVRWVSPSVREVFGWAPEEVVGRRFGLGTEAEQEAWAAFLASAPPSRTQSRRRFEAVRADGRRCWVEANATLVRDAEGRLERVVAAVRDIDEAVAAERQLADSERRYRLLAGDVDLRS